MGVVCTLYAAQSLTCQLQKSQSEERFFQPAQVKLAKAAILGRQRSAGDSPRHPDAPWQATRSWQLKHSQTSCTGHSRKTEIFILPEWLSQILEEEIWRFRKLSSCATPEIPKLLPLPLWCSSVCHCSNSALLPPPGWKCSCFFSAFLSEHFVLTSLWSFSFQCCVFFLFKAVFYTIMQWW